MNNFFKKVFQFFGFFKLKIRDDLKKQSAEKKLFLTRVENNPIISPRIENSWESWQTFNPGVVLIDDKIHFIYRAIGEEGLSRFGYAFSEDGLSISNQLSYPVFEHRIGSYVGNFSNFSLASGGSFGGCEDPRLVRVEGDDRIYMTYTACDGGLRLSLTSIAVEDFKKGLWRWAPTRMISPPGQVHKNWVIFPEKIGGKYAILHSISPELKIDYRESLDFSSEEYIESYYSSATEQRKDCWDGWVRGAGAPPIKTRSGWLLFYHAMDEKDPGKYKVGAMLLDLKDPTQILNRCSNPVLEPAKDFENNGYKSGVVYVSGAVVKDGTLFVYYGASDSYVAVATANLDEFIDHLVRFDEKPLLKKRGVKKNK